MTCSSWMLISALRIDSGTVPGGSWDDRSISSISVLPPLYFEHSFLLLLMASVRSASSWLTIRAFLLGTGTSCFSLVTDGMDISPLDLMPAELFLLTSFELSFVSSIGVLRSVSRCLSIDWFSMYLAVSCKLVTWSMLAQGTVSKYFCCRTLRSMLLPFKISFFSERPLTSLWFIMLPRFKEVMPKFAGATLYMSALLLLAFIVLPFMLTPMSSVLFSFLVIAAKSFWKACYLSLFLLVLVWLLWFIAFGRNILWLFKNESMAFLLANTWSGWLILVSSLKRLATSFAFFVIDAYPLGVAPVTSLMVLLGFAVLSKTPPILNPWCLLSLG